MTSLLHFLFKIFWYYALLKIIVKLYNTFYLFYKHFIRKGYDLKARYGKDSWVIVTGATDGIGKGLCEEFAKTGFNIILVSRTLSKLNDVANELKKINSSIKTHVVPFDFSEKTSVEDYTKAFGSLSDEYDISVLVNNIGTGFNKVFNQHSGKETQDMISLNVLPQGLMSDIFIKKFILRNKTFKSKGLKSSIINISSFASQGQYYNFILYNSVKGFNNNHSKLLSYELSEYDIDVMSVKPLWVDTPLIKRKKSIFKITTKQLSGAVLRQIGYEYETFGYIIHELYAYLVLSIPGFILRKVMKFSPDWS